MLYSKSNRKENKPIPTNHYIASCSFGKDSLAAITCRFEHGEPVDEAVYCRIMFDDEISAELPEHEEWIHTHAIPLLKSRYGVKTTIVQGNVTYCEQFYTKYVRSKNRNGQYYGFPMLRGPWCNSRLKVRPIEKWQKTVGEYKSIVGIAADEKKRQTRSTVNGKILPLVDYGITEAEAFEICRRADLLSPAYNGGRQRLACWFCHNQRIGELRRLRHEYPYLWRRLLEMEKDSFWTFKPGATLRGFEERFRNEDAQILLFDYQENRLCACHSAITACTHCRTVVKFGWKGGEIVKKKDFDKAYWDCVEKLMPNEEQAVESMRKIIGEKKTVNAMEMAVFAYVESIKYANDLVYSVLSKMVDKED